MSSIPERSRPIHPDVDIVAANRLWEEFESAPEPTESAAEILDRNYHDTISDYDRTAHLLRHLDLRVYGPPIRAGQLDIDIAKDLFGAFEVELAGAARAQGIAKAPRVELAGISPGSAVLHLAPTTGEDAPSSEQMQIVVDQFDAMVTRITALHQVAEDEGDLGTYADQAPLLKALRGLITILDRHDLYLEMNWRSVTGRHRRAVLTSRARAYVRRQWEDAPVSVERPLTGMVVKLDMNGTFVLSTAATGKRLFEIHVPDKARLLSLHLNLGDTISVIIEEQTRVNKVGMATSPRYELVRILSKAEMIEEPPGQQS